MPWLTLPEPRRHLAPAFHDTQSARLWLASLPQADPLPALTALGTQIAALDGAPLPPPVTLELLALLRTAAAPQMAALEHRYQRKPLPMPADDQACFERVVDTWQSLAIAYLRQLPHLPPSEQGLPLHRAASAARMAQYAHFQAARKLPVLLDHLPYGILAQGANSGQLQLPIDDPDFPHIEASTVSGQLAWTFLLRASNPYRLSAAQLAVTNRAFSRWRELASFQGREDAPQRPMIDLARLCDTPLPTALPQQLDCRKILRKLRLRRSALKQGESPEALKLGRELSTAACLRLLDQLERALLMPPSAPNDAQGAIELLFGAETLFALFAGQPFDPQATLAPGSATLSHQRVAMFGFDRVNTLPNAVQHWQLRGEAWRQLDGLAVRPVDPQATRRQSPCLIGLQTDRAPRLGQLQGLQCTADGTLSGELHWYPQVVTAGRWLPGGIGSLKGLPRQPVFLLSDDREDSLLLPPACAPALPAELTIDGLPHPHWRLLEVIERGVDFVRYLAIRK